ncbi:hypothetical protein MnBA_32960 [Marinobacterium sp. BA1]
MVPIMKGFNKVVGKKYFVIIILIFLSMPLLFNSIKYFYEKSYEASIIYLGLSLIVFGGTNKPEVFMNKIFESNENMGGFDYYIEYIGVFLIFFSFLLIVS